MTSPKLQHTEHMDTAGTFAVVLMHEKDRSTGKGTILYQGDNAQAAIEAANEANADPANVGLYVRTYNYTFFGGGMQDRRIEGK